MNYPRIDFTEKDRLECHQGAQRRSGSMNHADTRHSRHMHPGKHPSWRHELGELGERVYFKHTGVPMKPQVVGRGDDGEDFVDGTQVKATEFHDPDLLIPQGDWLRKPARRYAAIELRLEHGHGYGLLIGWITREEADKLKALDPDMPYGPAYIIARHHLHPFEPYKIPQQPQPAATRPAATGFYITPDCRPWLIIAGRILDGEFNKADRSTKESLRIGLRNIHVEIAQKALKALG